MSRKALGACGMLVVFFLAQVVFLWVCRVIYTIRLYFYFLFSF